MAVLDSTVPDYESHVALPGVDADGMQVIREIVHVVQSGCHLLNGSASYAYGLESKMAVVLVLIGRSRGRQISYINVS